MKKAKVSKGVVHHVWPWTKTLADGSTVTKELPNCYKAEKLGCHPDCIVDVPDDVQPGWVWDEGLQRYAPRVKHVEPPRRDPLISVLAEKFGVTYESLWDEIKARK